MAKRSALITAGAAFIALTSAAFAADVPALPPAPLPPPPEMNGWYIRGDVGVGFNMAPPGLGISPDPLAAGIAGGSLTAAATNSFFNSSLSESAMFGVGVGYQFNGWLRGDVTAELRGGSQFQSLEVINDSGNGAQFADFYRGNLRSYLMMVNGYADIGTWSGITPYVGAGIGAAYNQIYGLTDNGLATPGGSTVTGAAGGYFGNGGQWAFAWSLMTGVDFAITQNLKLELGYRYLNYGGFKSGGSNCLSGNGGVGFSAANCGGSANTLSSGALASSDFMLGFRYLLGEAPPPPIVRKF